MEWKSPNDVMRVHKIQKGTRSQARKSPNSREVSPVESNSKPRLKSTPTSKPLLHQAMGKIRTDEASSSSVNLKRINPFGKSSSDSLNSNPPAKRIKSSKLDNLLKTKDSDKNICDESTQRDESSQNLITNISGQLSPHFQSTNAATVQATKPINESVIEVASDEQSRKSSEVKAPQVQSMNTTTKSSVTLSAEYLTEDNAKHKADKPPLDWSVKTKLRIVIGERFQHMKKSPGIDARHLWNFSHNKLEESAEWQSLDLVQKIRRCCMHYSYPHLPGIPTFPRLSKDFKLRSQTSTFASNQEMLQALSLDWRHSLTSVYQQLRCGICPYFYVCCPQFTVLLRCQRSEHRASLSALLTPSTRGLRELLTKEGISFCLPNLKTDKVGKSKGQRASSDGLKESNSEESTNQSCNEKVGLDEAASNKSSTIGDDSITNTEKDVTTVDQKVDECAAAVDDDDDDDSDDDDDDLDDVTDPRKASIWLEGMGLDKKDFPSLDPTQVKLQQEGFREIDNRPQSMIYVEGIHVHPFFNFLLNYQGCWANSGVQLGIPPSILSPTPFLGGSLKQNAVKSSSITEGSEGRHVIEVSGPLLPHHTLNIASILQTCYNGPATMAYHTCTASAAFNTDRENDPQSDKMAEGLTKLFINIEDANPGLLKDIQGQLSEQTLLGSGSFVKELRIDLSGFSWL